MYSVPEVLDTIDAGGWVWVCLLMGWLCGFVQLATGIALAWRDGVVALPLAYIVIIFAHDSQVALDADHWFHDIDHWYFTISWFGFAACSLVEIVCIVWFARLTYREFRPAVPERWYYAIVALYVATAIAVYRLYTDVVDDPLHISGLFVAQIINIVFIIPLILRRGTGRGTHPVLAVALVGVGSFGMALPMAMVSQYSTGAAVASLICTTALALVYLALVLRFRGEGRRALAVA